MKLSFSTRGWWQEGWEELVATATEMRFQGIEIYNVLRRPELIGKGGAFHKYNVISTARELKKKGLAIPVFDTDCDLSTAEGTAELRRSIDIAGDMDVPYVYADCKSEDMDAIYANIEEIIPFAEEKEVTVLIKSKQRLKKKAHNLLGVRVNIVIGRVEIVHSLTDVYTELRSLVIGVTAARKHGHTTDEQS